MITAVLLAALSALPLGSAQTIQPAYERSAAECTTKSVRKSWTDLTTKEKKAYIEADLCLMSAPPKSGIEDATSRWDELQYAHAVQVRYIHFVGAFLPFHRYFVTVHEHLLRTECDYDGPLPYWDEPADVGDIHGSSLFTADVNFGGDGTGEDGCIEDGPFANLTLHFKEDLTTTDYCISRSMTDKAFSSADRRNVEECLEFDSFIDAWRCIENKPHGGGHGGVSGTMVNLFLSPGDPVFYLHHGYLDRVWYEWQSGDLSKRLTEIGGNNTSIFPPFGGGGGGGGGFGFNLTDSEGLDFVFAMPPPDSAFEDYFNDGGKITTLNHTLWSANIMENVTIADVMNPTEGWVCADYGLPVDE
ncbi:Di-copper centre-containing protein [Poronia punctata]|nr:Di-copper centre-containing protein [Poronia punctata]